MKEIDIKDRLYQQFSRIGKCLSSDKRLEIMDILSNGPKSVEGLATQTGMNVANVSRHLQILLDAKLVKCCKKGTYVIYSIGNPLVIEFLSSLWRICEDRLSGIKQIKTELELQYPEVQTITKHDLLEKMKKKTVILLDIRPTDEYDASHIPDAISIPLDQLENYLKTVDKSTIELAAYCRGPYCSLASQAVDYMLKQGYMAYRIEEGVHDWNVCEEP
ncbi:metalloregulator ArsR/SmtB family transcription factor [Paenibacillus polymyxa]|uniref:metalloregulator ArsR/SmtB family transcription factor n=1 Tax=Paenibacillus polymyxa TaxID=1406 RepID=UPI002D9198DF|nr:metalloregulator ArsR/SmtB family transcription factor [Paenibacillus jamilae]MEE4563880.1 metalloregulator ArsR/SmtB family transcription factor [Paenibacillus polymyxa]